MTITTSQLARSIINWLVNSELYTGSDHEVIQFTIISNSIETAPLPTITNRYNWKKADWEKFSTRLIELSSNNSTTWRQLCYQPSEENLEQAACLLRDNLLNAVEYAIPTIRQTPRTKSWWSDTIKQERTNMLRLKRTWKNNKTKENWQAFKIQRNLYFKSIRKAKESLWIDFLA